MRKMTEQELTDKIRQVFDNFEDPFVEHGWQELRKKYPEGNGKPALIWWSSAAAVFLVTCGLWFLASEHNKTDKKHTIEKQEVYKENKNRKHVIVKNSTLKSHPHIPFRKNNNGIEQLNYTANSLISKSDTSIVLSTIIRSTPHQGIPYRSISDSLTKNNLKQVSSLSLSETTTVVPPAISTDGLKYYRDSIISATAILLALVPSNITDKSNPPSVQQLPPVSHNIKNKNFLFSFYAGSYFNYAEGSETKLNFGAGFTSDIKLGNNIRLTTGLSISKNSLSYDGNIPSRVAEQKSSLILPSAGNSYSNHTTITKYSASLLTLDIPVNIKYLLIPGENKFYFSAGLSSGTYLAENYAFNYRNYNISSGFYMDQKQGDEIKKQFKDFDLARTMNISLGYSTNLGKTQNITIEPFLKYPLGGLGSENIRFGSTGINLKLNFSTFKK